MSTYERRYTYCEHNMHASIFLFLQVSTVQQYAQHLVDTVYAMVVHDASWFPLALTIVTPCLQGFEATEQKKNF